MDPDNDGPGSPDYTIESGQTLDTSSAPYTFNNVPNFKNEGTLNFDQTGTFTNFSGTMDNTGTMTVEDNGSSTTYNERSKLTNSGVLNIDSGAGFSTNSSGEVTNESTGIINNNGSYTNNSSTINNGTINNNTGSFFNNNNPGDGLINNNGSVFNNSGELGNTSTVEMNAGSTIHNDGSIYNLNTGTFIFDIESRTGALTDLGNTNEGLFRITSSNTSTVNIYINDSLGWDNSDKIVLVEGTSSGSSFGTLYVDQFNYYNTDMPTPSTFGGWSVSTGDATNNGFTDLFLTYTASTPIPEPETYALMGGFILMTLLFSRKPRKAAVKKVK